MNRAQKSLNLDERLKYIASSRQILPEMPSSDVPSLTKTLNLIETITKIQIKDRTKELKKIYAKCEDLYLVCELTNTKHLLGFLAI